MKQLVKNVKIYAFENLQDVLNFLNGKPYKQESVNIEEIPLEY